MKNSSNKLVPKTNVHTKKEAKIKPKDQLFKSDDELKSEIVPKNNCKEVVVRQESTNKNKVLSPFVPELKLWLDTVPHARMSLSRIIRKAGRGEYPIDQAGKMAYLIQTLLQAFRVEAELSVLDRIAALEKELKKAEKQ